jgi:hypothetical protein
MWELKEGTSGGRCFFIAEAVTTSEEDLWLSAIAPMLNMR